MDDRFRSIALLIGDKARASMLWQLIDGKALTASELALSAGVSPQSASMHLNKLLSAGLLAMERQGRHRYYRLSGPETAYAVEAIANLVPADKRVHAATAGEVDELRFCRSCYDHLAGRVAVGLADHLVQRNIIARDGPQFEITRKGTRWFEELGIDVTEVKNSRRFFARACLDWSERRHHLAGALGAALLDSMLASDWVRRRKHSRSLLLTSKGRRRMYDLLGFDT